MPSDRTTTAITDALRQAGTRYRAARAEERAAHEAVKTPVVKALKAGLPQAQIVELSGLSREFVRLTARRIGIEGPEWAAKLRGPRL